MQQFLQFIILTFIYNSTCFGRPHAHNQEFNNYSSSLWFYLRSMVIAVLLVVVGWAGPNTNKSTATTTF
jgi:ATP-dependent phosphoenolpyruvate carboxykinase